MKGQAKRFVNHKGQAHVMDLKKNQKEKEGKETRTDEVGFLQLWRYATPLERLATCLGVLASWLCSCGLVLAVLIYGELTALFVARHKAARASSPAVLHLFHGGREVPDGNRSLHMDALIEDSIAFALASAAIMACQLLAAAAAVTLANWAAARMVSRLRYRLLRSVLRQEMAFFDTNTTLNFASALTEDMDKFRGGVGEHVVMTSYLAGSVVAAASLSLYYGWQLTLVGLAVVPIAILVAATVAKYQTRCSAEEVAAYGAAGRSAEEALAAIRTVRALGGEEVEVQRYKRLLAPAKAASSRRGLWAGAGSGLGWLLTYSLNAVVFAYGTILCVRDMNLQPEEQDYHPGIMVIVLFCTFMASQNIAMCHPHLELFAAARGAAASLYRLLERRSKIDAMLDRGEKLDKLKGEIVFEDVYFNYPSRPDVKVLRGFNLRVSPGDTVALVGGSGCGKSTTLQLLQRLYEPAGGSVKVDGRPLNELNITHYRRSIGVVGQEPVLFGGTIRENIALGIDYVSEADIIEAATIANAHGFISKLKNGYDTVIGERGASLSGGQKQRVAIARAVLRKPAILLLDEPTSALDPAAERQVQAALDAASKGRTTLVVSHRLSTIVNATRIAYVEHGAVLEQGSHRELLEKKGLYWKLVQEDMSTESMEKTCSDVESEEDEDVVEESRFKRAPSIRSSRRESLTPERLLRGSMRLGSMAGAHVLNVAVPDLDHIEETSGTEEEAAEAPVTSLQLLKLNTPEWPLLLGGGLASLLVGATMPVFALLFSQIYAMFAESDPNKILSQSQLYAGLFAGVAATCGAVTFLQTWLFGRAGTRLTTRLRENTLRNYLYQEQGWFDRAQNSVGALCARLATDAAAVQGATGTRLGTVLQGISTMAIGVSLAMAYSWKMTLVSLLSVPCVIGGIYLEGYVMKKAEVKEKKALEQASRIATEAVSNVRTVQSLGVESTILDKYLTNLQEASARAGRASLLRGPVYGLCLCAPTLGYAVSLSFGGYLIAREDLPYAYAILVSEALIYGAWMLAEALSFAPNFAAARRSGARILRALQRTPRVITEGTAAEIPDWSATGDITLNDVHFTYPSRPGAPVLRGLSLQLPAGQRLALVGTSGSGKSTIVSLLLRSYDADSGNMLLDDADIRRTLTLRQLRSQLGLVQQEPALFERSIRENIAYGDVTRKVSMDEIIHAAEQANVHSFIASLPQGYETRLGQGGASLSGGQKQRIAIARALVRRPRVLLLDEATSALDANSEKTVQLALEAASEGRTTITIAHRLATVRHHDLIAVVDKGVVAEIGSHEELAHKRGLYWELLQQQGPC
ncbi:multidrug resistance protein homolog 49-like [Cydia strobilella]|uniref:multidrug resistance protein homolog 49-like n=1 Tax=Cydia strobilella TaxID=1100964 RepID=UPI003006CC9F